mgnify:CR=1 FL=1
MGHYPCGPSKGAWSDPFALDRLAVNRGKPVIPKGLHFEALTGQQLIARLVPFSGLVVMPQNGTCSLRLVRETQRQIRLYQTVQRLGGVGGGLEILDDNAEAVDRRGVMLAAQIIAPDFHFLARQMVKGQIEF